MLQEKCAAIQHRLRSKRREVLHQQREIFRQIFRASLAQIIKSKSLCAHTVSQDRAAQCHGSFPGKYEISIYNVISANRAPAAEHLIFDSAGNISTNLVNQTNSNNAGWYKLGDYLLSQGRNRVLQLSNRGLTGSQLVGADALMIVLNRRLSTPVKLSVLSIDSGEEQFQMRLQGAAGQKLAIEASSDLGDWFPLDTVTLTNSLAEFSALIASNSSTYHRTRLAP